MRAPSRIEPFSSTEILLAWTDGEVFAIPYLDLRFHCPCANCIDEHTGERIVQRSTLEPAVRTTSVHTVGRYALQISFSDGHSTGIYPYERLSQICERAGRRIDA